MQIDALPFDPTVYFGHVADNLLTKFGGKALTYADEALKKMRALGDDEGFDMWMGVQQQLALKAPLQDLSDHAPARDKITLH